MGCCSGPDIPEAPDPYTTYLEGFKAEGEAYPLRRFIEAMMATGGKGEFDGTSVDYTGQGDVDYQKAYADKMAQVILDIQKEYGPQYIEQALAELDLADPEGREMRKKLWDSIQADIGRVDERQKLSDDIQAVILEDLKKGGTLEPEVERAVMQKVRGGQASIGHVLGTASGAQEGRALVSESEARLADRQNRALLFLTSGMTPEDIEYKRTQQAMSNLGAFIAGETPQAQFGDVQGAQEGAVPVYQGNLPSGVDTNSGKRNLNYMNSMYGSTANIYANQANPYMAGLGMGMQGAMTGLWLSMLSGGGGGGGAAAGAAAANAAGNAATIGFGKP